MKHTNFDKNNFNIIKFNKIYDENKLEDNANEGYEDWINSNSFDSEDIIRNNNLTKGNFNDVFNSNVKVSNQLVKHKVPEALFMNDDNSCIELGQTKVENYTGKTKNINFTDYKEAHTTNKLVDTNMQYKKYKDLNDIKFDRSVIKDLSQEELIELDLQKENEKQREIERLRNLKLNDQRHFDNYERVNKLMLGRL